jgi:hypothetical protein
LCQKPQRRASLPGRKSSSRSRYGTARLRYCRSRAISHPCPVPRNSLAGISRGRAVPGWVWARPGSFLRRPFHGKEVIRGQSLLRRQRRRVVAPPSMPRVSGLCMKAL